MARLAPKPEVLRPLFARSGNQCAFPSWTHPLIDEKNNFIAQVCHIEAAKEDGERYNPAQTDEERRGYNNLILLCYRHHVETNDVVEYPVTKLIAIKREHEQRYSEHPFSVSLSTLINISNSFSNYYQEIEQLHK